MSRFLIVLGLVIVVLGILWPVIAKLGLGRLPGDIMLERGSFRLYVPIATSIIVSLVLSIVFWWMGK